MYTPVDLYRNGNASGPRMDRVRTDLSHPGGFDIRATADALGAGWVDTNVGGISTLAAPDPQWIKVWKLAAGASLPPELRVWNDLPGHWSWEPAYRMRLIGYVAALASVNALFVRTR
jgi:hypothetical protein